MKVTCILLTYNSERFVAEALQSLFAQDFSEPMEILVSDDASTDSTAEILERELGSDHGPHHVRLIRQPRNTGSKSAHLNEVFPLASGEILVSLDADDVSEPQRVRRTVDAFRRDPRVMAVYSQLVTMDEHGRPLGPGGCPRRPAGLSAQQWFARVDSHASGGTLAIRRSVVTAFPPLDPNVAEDVSLPFRASLLGDVAFIDEPLIRARRHGGSLTADFERFSSLDAYRRRMLIGIERAKEQLSVRLADLDCADKMFPGRAREWEELRRLAHESLRDAELTAGLYGPRALTRWTCLLRLYRANLYPESRLSHAAVALMPGAYLLYKRRVLLGRG